MQADEATISSLMFCNPPKTWLKSRLRSVDTTLIRWDNLQPRQSAWRNNPSDARTGRWLGGVCFVSLNKTRSRFPHRHATTDSS